MTNTSNQETIDNPLNHIADNSLTENLTDDKLINNNAQENAVMLLSGGLDSVTCLYWAKARYQKVTAISFNYGQRHNSELQTAIANAKQANVHHRIIDIDIAQLGGSSLTD
ncbi:MAG: 7-cyano-7-deazaguanine synthase, partial [Pseudomonadales bacterium]